MTKAQLICLIGKNASGKGTASEYIQHISGLISTSVGHIIRSYCITQNLDPTRDTCIALGNGIFDGAYLSKCIYKALPNGGILDGIRKPETLQHLQNYYHCILIGILTKDELRFQRSLARNRYGDKMTFSSFMENEIQENSPPNKQNINLLLSQCHYYCHNNQDTDSFYTQISQVLKKIDMNQSAYLHST